MSGPTKAVMKAKSVSGLAEQLLIPKTVLVNVYGVGVRRSVITD